LLLEDTEVSLYASKNNRPEFGSLKANSPAFLGEIYQDFVPISELDNEKKGVEVWRSRGWLSYLESFSKQFNFPLLTNAKLSSTPQPLFSAMVATELARHQKLRILDFGGSIGENFLSTLQVINEFFHSQVEWIVCDGEDSMQVGRALWENSKLRPRFMSLNQIKNEGLKFNICLLRGTLQYVDLPFQLIDDIFENLLFKGSLIFVDRTPLCISSETDVIIRQLVYPPLGEWKDRYIGELQLHLFSFLSFGIQLSKQGRSIALMHHRENYVTQMQALPLPFKQVHYIDLTII